jgi:hypothetical protein
MAYKSRFFIRRKMKLNAPTKLAFLIAVIVFVLGILFQFVPFLAGLVTFPLGVILLIVAFVILALGNILKNF